MMKKNILFLILFAITFSSQAQFPTCRENHESHGFAASNHKFRSGHESLRSDTIDVLNYSIYLDFTTAELGTLRGNCEVKFSPLMDVTSLSLDLLQLNVDSVKRQGTNLPFSYNDSLLIVQFGTTLSAGVVDSITVYYQGSPPTDPSGWGGFYMTGGYYYNIGVGFESDPHNFGRVWHPCFDNFVERATYDFSILTDGVNRAYCNGIRLSVDTVGADSLLAKWQLSTAIPSYLASVAVSSYTHVEQTYYSNLQGINIPVWLAAKPADTTNLKASFINLHQAIEAYENYFGPYVWDRVGYVVVPFNAGAMEHATNIAYPILTVNGSIGYQTLMAHELSHHWWGDWVTCETAEEMWINEGMAKYSEHLFLEWVYDYDEYMETMRDNHYDVLRHAHHKDSGFYALNAVPHKYTYGDHSYNKGADVLHTLRSYMGDDLFFQGLKSVQSAYGGTHMSSVDFMQHLNTLAGVDVTDFFESWIFQPGFAHFGLSHLEVEATGSGPYSVNLVVGQKLKGGASYHQNVPLELTFMDAQWNTHTENIEFSGHYQPYSFTLPINPVFIAVNYNERINDATTAVNVVLTGPSVQLMNYANVRMEVASVTDSALVRVEHNWVYPDHIGIPDDIQISMERYWNIHGINLDQVTATLRFEFNGRPIATGNLDNNLMVDLGNQPFTEDSLVLLYRPDSEASWQIHDDYTISFAGSHTDKYGFITANYFKKGQYTFGYRTNSVGLVEQDKQDLTYSIYPNPASDSVIIDLTNWKDEPLSVEIIGLDGKLILNKKIFAGQTNSIDISDLASGIYLAVILDQQGNAKGSKRISVR